ncbi:hypothetical protein [Enterococcus mundtii]|uniref:Uncharacterized protein n=1 Tax=Enterococcus mundtii TaxID=53346 RepID=A0A242L0F2_ENTMU|nr:hypothetical protein [Enterococcus mundtii]OTP27673.1 hypothetical protein A5802_001409 [Enterococcus mundtii]
MKIESVEQTLALGYFANFIIIKERGRIAMQKRKNSGKLSIFLAVISAIPAVLAVVRAIKESKQR